MVDYSTVVEQVVDQLFHRFRAAPSLFFTESDLVCEFYRLLLTQVPDPYVKDADGNEHLVIHTEYPTPFRCDMSGSNFEVKGDEETTGRGTKFKRGHLDLVILNHEVIKELTAEEVMMQDYQKTKHKVLSMLGPDLPMILHAIEFQYYRGELTPEGAERFVKVIRQDHDKLAACCRPRDGQGVTGFVEKYESLVFFLSAKSAALVEKEAFGTEGIRLCYP